MKRLTLSFASFSVVASLVACSGKVDDGATIDAGAPDADAIVAETSPPVSDLGSACVPAMERDPRSGGAVLDDLSIDPASPDCAPHEVCLSDYFQGRVTCPYGNGGVAGQSGKCQPVAGRPTLFRIDGAPGGALCCPQADGVTPIAAPIPAQCTGRTAHDAVYCSCRCDVPSDPAIDRSKIDLCRCAEGFVCKPLCDATRGSCGAAPKSTWGSYCVRAGAKGADYDPGSGVAMCGAGLAP